MNATGYTRVSTGKQAKEGVSLDEQRVRIESWCKAHGYTVSAIEKDALSGGKAENRAGLNAALDRACRERGPLVVYDLSRLARSLPDAVRILERLTKAGASLVCLSEGIDTTTPTGELIYNVLSAVNQFVLKVGRERTRAAIRHKQANGEYTGGEPPFGKKKIRLGVSQMPVLVDDPDEQRIIGMIRRGRETMTPAGVARFLNGAGVQCRGSVWHAKTVARILQREAR